MDSRGLHQFGVFVEPAEIATTFQYADGFAIKVLVAIYTIGVIQVEKQPPLRREGRRHKLHPLLPGTVAHQAQHHVDLALLQHQLQPAKRCFPVFDRPAKATGHFLEHIKVQPGLPVRLQDPVRWRVIHTDHHRQRLHGFCPLLRPCRRCSQHDQAQHGCLDERYLHCGHFP